MAGTYGKAGGSYQLVLKMPQLTDIYISLTIIFAVTYTVIKSNVCCLSFWDTLSLFLLILAPLFIPGYRIEKP